MTQSSGQSSPRAREHPSPSPAPPTSSSSSQSEGAHHHFEHMPAQYANAMGGVLVVEPHMVPPGYVLGQVVPPRPEEPEEPLYVNAKQYHRILKRRAARASLEAENRLQQRGRKFLHLSRHNHAMRRPRGPGGRFLTAAEIAAMQQDKDKSGDGNDQDTSSSYDADQAYQVQHQRQQQLKQEELMQHQQQSNPQQYQQRL
ncbi:CCAAT-binding transcription factor (CBF-B/NF-YA) subunit B-domain-containing protein [Mortierella sp. GBAus27b]|nr:CCAAT-binding transcription factor (CBF-B/NF-YA) subunit B-domain-containing protein [Mortierella sp. GBAus27b]